MQFKMIHENYNVADLDRSLAFYENALGLYEKRRKTASDGSFIIVYIGNIFLKNIQLSLINCIFMDNYSVENVNTAVKVNIANHIIWSLFGIYIIRIVCTCVYR